MYRKKRALVHHLTSRGILVSVKESCPRFSETSPEKILYCSISLMRLQTQSTMSWNYLEKCHSSTAENTMKMDYIVLEITTRVCAVMVARNL